MTMMIDDDDDDDDDNDDDYDYDNKFETCGLMKLFLFVLAEEDVLLQQITKTTCRFEELFSFESNDWA